MIIIGGGNFGHALANYDFEKDGFVTKAYFDVRPELDGTDIRVPFFTSYDPKTGSWIIENHGVDPDILIDNDPVKEWNGEDQQLDRAIQEVMKELRDRKPLPGIPAPRDFSK